MHTYKHTHFFLICVSCFSPTLCDNSEKESLEDLEECALKEEKYLKRIVHHFTQADVKPCWGVLISVLEIW